MNYTVYVANLLNVARYRPYRTALFTRLYFVHVTATFIDITYCVSGNTHFRNVLEICRKMTKI